MSLPGSRFNPRFWRQTWGAFCEVAAPLTIESPEHPKNESVSCVIAREVQTFFDGAPA
jgi:hypothetical protein